MLSVSCLCPTYGRCPDRQYLLEEAVESFARQDYPGPRELLIVNDCPAQQIVCDAPGARVLNLPFRFGSLGAKYNVAVGAANGEVLLPFEDDDLALPHRISQAVERLGASHYWKPGAVWYWPAGGQPTRDHGGVGHNASAFRRSAWLASGGYPATSGNQDLLFDAALLRLGEPAPPLGPEDRPAYVYRWGVSEHLSGNADHEGFYRAFGERPVTAGRFTLRPHWRDDYAQALTPLQ